MTSMSVVVSPPNELANLSRRIRTHATPRALRKEMLNGLKKGTAPAQGAVKRAALGLPSKHGSGRARARIAAATTARVRTGGKVAGVKVVISRARAAQYAALAYNMNKSKWRHPVFDHKDTWVDQYGRKGWFDQANFSQRKAVTRELETVLTKINSRVGNR